MKRNIYPINSDELGEVVSSCVCFNLRKASRVITQHFDAILKPSGLLITQFIGGRDWVCGDRWWGITERSFN
jgi:hypothetical protein